MKCSNPECIADARLVLRRKQGPMAAFHKAAEDSLGYSRQEVLGDGFKRRRVLGVARQMAFVEESGTEVCPDCVDWAVEQLHGVGIEEGVGGDFQMVPLRSRIIVPGRRGLD